MSDERGLWGKRFTRQRWAKYLALLKGSTGEPISNEKLARVLGEGTKRIREWLKGEKRGISPGKAFDSANVLRDELGLATSGLECLYACGFWPELLDLFKHVSTDRLGGGPQIATYAYCVLPDVRFERLVFGEALRILPPAQADLARRRHSADIELLESEQLDNTNEEWMQRRSQAVDAIRDPATRRVVQTAWNHSVQGRVQVTGEGEVDEENLAIIDSIKALSKQRLMTEAPPTIIGIRLWRMLAEWANGLHCMSVKDPVAPKYSYDLAGLIPNAFSMYHERELRHNDAMEAGF